MQMNKPFLSFPITMYNDVAMNLFCYVLLHHIIAVSPVNSSNYTHKPLKSTSNQ